MKELTKGSLLHGGAYKIEHVLGQGSFGITYLATHIALNKKVAIKEFFMKELNGRSEDGSITGMSDGSLSMDYARKFQKEALNLSRLDHPNIVRVTDSFEDNGTFYYVMDYIEGDNLNDYVKHNHISQQEALNIIRDVAKALMYMHEEKHMLHLDMKPSNIMRRNSDGHIFIIDFGLSKHYSYDGQPETSTTIGLGTQGYAPIEQANQVKNCEFQPTIDIYALGATFYKLLTSETPPVASELVNDDNLLSEKFLKHDVGGELADIVINAMAPSAKKRLRSVREFFDKTTILVEEKGLSDIHDTAEDTLVEESQNFVKETKSRKRFVILLVLALVAVVASYMYFQLSSSDIRNGDTLSTKHDTITIKKENKNNKKIEYSSINNDANKPFHSATVSKKGGNKDNSTAENMNNVDKSSILKRALASGNYQIVQELANQGYAAAYAPLAKYYLRNNEYHAAENYARKAKNAGYSEGKRILNMLENLGYFD